MTTGTDFAALWPEVVATSPLCVGIDPHAHLLESWGLPATAAGARDFGLRMVEAAAGVVGSVKPQAAFYEVYGSAGLAALEDVVAAARASDLAVILDAKRGDIGSTMAGYARAYLDPASPLYAEALTVSPYLGFGSLAEAVAASAEFGSGLFVLALTSNPDGPQVQHARTVSGTPVARAILDDIEAANAEAGAVRIGAVVGATTGPAMSELGIDPQAYSLPYLAPGFGAQGAGVEDLVGVFGEAFVAGRVIVPTSRALSSLGPDVSAMSREAAKMSDALKSQVRLR